jgi:hypothetical protein
MFIAGSALLRQEYAAILGGELHTLLLYIGGKPDLFTFFVHISSSALT